MEQRRVFIAGDWGTSALRLFLCRGTEVLDQVTGTGVGRSSEPASAIFRRLAAPWIAEHGPLRAVLCGMVGSTIGWRPVPYVPCPAGAAELAGQALHFTDEASQISIIPGLSCTNPLSAPDVMRGEETQIFGALARMPALMAGRHIAILPGTHTKWAAIRDGHIDIFHTVLTGEIFALLREHSTLARGADADGPAPADAFADGLARIAANPGSALTELLFEIRSRQLIENLPRDSAMSYLSGLLIGADIVAGRRIFENPSQVLLIGEPALCALYETALQRLGASALFLHGNDCALAGLQTLSAQSPGERDSHALPGPCAADRRHPAGHHP